MIFTIGVGFKKTTLIMMLAFNLSLVMLSHIDSSVQATVGEYSVVKKWGTQGNDFGQFDDPRGVAVDSVGNVYVADTKNNRIQKFSNSGIFVTNWNTTNSPVSIAVGPSDEVFVGEMGSQIQKYTDDGTLIKSWNVSSSVPSATYLSVGGSGIVYVSINIDDRIQKFASDGKELEGRSWGSSNGDVSPLNLPRFLAIDSSIGKYLGWP